LPITALVYRLFFSDNPLLVDDILYQYLDGDTTPFYRKITINNIDDHTLEVVSKVTWRQRGRNLEVVAKTRLYDWR